MDVDEERIEHTGRIPSKFDKVENAQSILTSNRSKKSAGFNLRSKTSNLSRSPRPSRGATPPPNEGLGSSGPVWQDFLAPVQHFVRREMTTFHLETTSPPEAVLSCEIAQINQENLLYRYMHEILLDRKNHYLMITQL